MGGESDSMIFDTTEMLDPGVDTRLMTQTLMVPRCGLGLCALGDSVYAFGGWVGSEIGASVEKFDPEEGCWIRWDRMTMPRYTMGVVECEGELHHNYKEVLYAFSYPWCPTNGRDVWPSLLS